MGRIRLSFCIVTAVQCLCDVYVLYLFEAQSKYSMLKTTPTVAAVQVHALQSLLRKKFGIKK